ncbi:GGDEF domain-containing protein [Brevibacillus migulae]|uniref:GGDEF domain-containing protein n=1 Tax=Brevibacillus migulae TaxID=1644114 RepID=UPI00106DE6BA|nr:GGDEF domain-containing protein [Brevibacillus migulae]
MDHTLHIVNHTQRLATFLHHEEGSAIRFHHHTWDHFPRSVIKERLRHWQYAANGPWYRRPLTWFEESDGLTVPLPPLPAGFSPLVEIASRLDETDWINLLSSLSRAIDQLHQHGFVMGILSPERIYFHTKTGEVLLDVQPFPHAYPFVDKALPDYPFAFLSPYARHHVMPRIADYYGIGLLIKWLALESFPDDLDGMPDALPEPLLELSTQLIQTPEQFHSASEIVERAFFRHPSEMTKLSADVHTGLEYLHPITPPILPEDKKVLSSFLQKKEACLFSLISTDEAARYDVYNEHLNASLEKHVFFPINCLNLPYSCLRELIERTVAYANARMPFARSPLNRLLRQFERIIGEHNTGGEIVELLAEWLFKMYHEISPLIEQQSFFYTLEDCENLDEDSQRVFIYFWKTYGERLNGVYLVFSGREKPSLFLEEAIRNVPIVQKSKEMYRHLLSSRLGKVDPLLLERLTQQVYDAQADYIHVRLLVEDWVQRGILTFSTAGWRQQEMFPAEDLRASIREIIVRRLSALSPNELDILRILICLPRPVRAKSIFQANGLNVEELYKALDRFQRLGLAHVYSVNRIFVPVDVASLALYQLPQHEQQHYYRHALTYQHRFRPSLLPQLIELSMLAGDKRREYYFLIRYYRKIRSLLSLERRKGLLESLKELQQALQRDRLICWDRLLYQAYVKLYRYEQAAQTARALLQKTGEAFDRFSLLRVLLYTNQLDVPQTKQELFTLLEDRRQPLNDRSRAADLIAHLNLFSPLLREGAEVLDRFYREEFYPQRASLSKHLFAEFTLSYVVLVFDYFPEHKEWAAILRQKLESMLSHSTYHDLLIELYNSYLFHQNIKIAHTYNQRQLALARRFGFIMKEEISYINGMEMALYLGDTIDYRHYLAHARQIKEWKRTDLRDQFLNHQLLYACEWKDWSLFETIEKQLLQLDVSDYAFFYWEIISRYAAFRRSEPLPPPTVWAEENDATLFIDALYQIESGNSEDAIRLFKQAIAANGSRIFSGWALREMIALLLQQHSEETPYWLDQLKKFLHTFAYDIFWPDYFRFSAEWNMQTGDKQRALLAMRRASNIYQLIEKSDYAEEMKRSLADAMLPEYVPANAPLAMEPEVQQLLAERKQLLQYSLDLQIIMQLSEQVTEELELGKTLQRLSHALFEYFPITLIAIDFQLLFRREKVFYRASGTVKDVSQLRSHINQLTAKPYRISLYQHGKQTITLEVYSSVLAETNRIHMEHFLSFIKPHVANALLYMEMMIDGLTGFYQRRFFMERLSKELLLAKQYDLDLSVIMLDIDNFRLINLHGHQEGDRVLSEVAEIVRGVLRPNDIPGRYGGEELLLILPKTSGADALRLAREIRRQIEEAFDSRAAYKVTVSVGVSTLAHASADTVDDLVRLADDAEIVAKKSGKNRVVAAWEMEQGRERSNGS